MVFKSVHRKQDSTQLEDSNWEAALYRSRLSKMTKKERADAEYISEKFSEKHWDQQKDYMHGHASASSWKDKVIKLTKKEAEEEEEFKREAAQGLAERKKEREKEFQDDLRRKGYKEGEKVEYTAWGTIKVKLEGLDEYGNVVQKSSSTVQSAAASTFPSRTKLGSRSQSAAAGWMAESDKSQYRPSYQRPPKLKK